MQRSNKNLAGLLLFVGSTIGFLGIIIAETLYPGYSTAKNVISDLGIGPSAAIFNIALIIGGLLGIASAYFLIRTFRSKLFVVVIGLSSLGLFFVGVFPENTGGPHVIGALLAFIFGGLAAILSYRLTKTHFRQVSVVLGAISLLAFILFIAGIHLGLGGGGMERMVVYPNMFWSIGFGGNLMADTNN